MLYYLLPVWFAVAGLMLFFTGALALGFGAEGHRIKKTLDWVKLFLFCILWPITIPWVLITVRNKK